MMKNAEETFFVEAKRRGERTCLLILMGILFVVDMNMRMRMGTEKGTESRGRSEGRECRMSVERVVEDVRDVMGKVLS